ncbi:hypothetical protein DNTS_022657 [Danionella cerebrum]|uniref:Uncharacterized protein n=1 Tax=Danionella cerebrum TaxID=2873325 RepID=A0A553NGG4_9TELE|nr:hypothetical protein DNTS_022657 [Danionella translucida]
MALKKKKSRFSFFKRIWKAIRRPMCCCETRVEEFVAPVEDPEPEEPHHALYSVPKLNNGSGCEMAVIGSGGCGFIEDSASVHEFSLSRESSEWTLDQDGTDGDSLELLSVSSCTSSYSIVFEPEPVFHMKTRFVGGDGKKLLSAEAYAALREFASLQNNLPNYIPE